MIEKCEHRDKPPEGRDMAPPGESPRTHSRIVIGHHLVLHGYGQWLPNDPRGSGSAELRQDKFSDLGPIHFGRKRVQPPRETLQGFYRNANPRLDFQPIWFNSAKRQVIGEAFSRVVRGNRYTVWACAVLSNHAHLCIRRHRDDAGTMWRVLAEASAQALGAFSDVPKGHPIWSSRPYKVFLYTPEDVRRVIAYIEHNSPREGLAPQRWGFVTPYDGWPHPKEAAGR